MAQKSKTNSNYETLALVLLVSGLAGFFLWLWQIIYMPAHLVGYLNLSFSLFDFYLAFAFFKNKPKIKKAFLLRIFLGLICWLVIFYLSEAQYGLIWAKIAFLSSLAIFGLDKIKKPVIIALAALIFLFTNAYFSASYISSRQKLLINLKEYGKDHFTSKTYDYKVEAPSGWKIIKRDNFPQTKESFLETEAEIALFTQDGGSFCLIIPNKKNSFKETSELSQLKEMLVANLKMKKTVKIGNISFFPDKNTGFQIKYTDIIEGVRQNYIIIYLSKENFDLEFIGWTLENNQEKIYKEIKNIAKSATINKN